ncbi:MAG: alpha/beta fold hydrolase [Capsulimonadaceae bacterium]
MGARRKSNGGLPTLITAGVILVASSGCGVHAQSDSPGLVARAVTFIHGLAAGDSASTGPAMDATMSAAFPPAAQTSTWNALTAQCGTFIATGETSTSAVAGYDVVYVTCVFQHTSVSAKVVFDKSQKVGGLFFLPVAVPEKLPTGVIERSVTFDGAGGVRIAGSLMMRNGSTGPGVPALVLIAGSGPVDRNGNSGPEFQPNTLQDIAVLLAKAGVATLRYDKRGIGESATQVTDLENFCAFDNFVGDAAAALRFVKSQPGIDPARVGFAGHSEGGMIALAAAAHLSGSPDTPFALVLLSTPGRPEADVLHDQIARLGKPDLTAKSDAICAQIRDTGIVPAGIPAELAAIFPAYAVKLLQPEFKLNTPSLARQYTGPVLVIQGGGDVQVSADKDGPRLDAALAARQHDNHLYYVAPHTSHNLKLVSDDTDPGIEGDIASGVADVLAKWAARELGNNTSSMSGGIRQAGK